MQDSPKRITLSVPVLLFAESRHKFQPSSLAVSILEARQPTHKGMLSILVQSMLANFDDRTLKPAGQADLQTTA